MLKTLMSFFIISVVTALLSVTLPTYADEDMDKIIDCPNGTKRVVIECLSQYPLVDDVKNINMVVAKLPLGFGSKFEKKAVGQITDTTYQMALKFESLCRDYNSCLISADEYNQQAKFIRTTLGKHVDLAKKLIGGEKVGESLWANALPEMDRDRIRLNYRLEAQHPGTSEVIKHADGGTLSSGDRLRFVVSTNQPTYVYILLLSSQGEPSQLFPQAAIGLQNPVKAGQETIIPPQGSFELDGVPGLETLHILAAKQPINDIERRLAGLSSTSATTTNSILPAIGDLVCNGTGAETRGMKLSGSWVSCGGSTSRGLVHKPDASFVGIAYAAQPNDDVIVVQHRIDHK